MAKQRVTIEFDYDDEEMSVEQMSDFIEEELFEYAWSCFEEGETPITVHPELVSYRLHGHFFV